MLSNMNAILQQLGTLGIIPVVVIEDEANAEPLAQALIDGGLPTMEVTFRTDAAKNALTRVAKVFPQVCHRLNAVRTNRYIL